MGYIKYSWVRGKHTVQYPELKHVIHTEINNLPGPRPGLHSLRMRFWYASSSCRRQESWVKTLVTTGTHLKTWSSADIGTKVAVFQPLNFGIFHNPAGEEPKQVTGNLKTRSTPMINPRNISTGYASPLDCSLMKSGAACPHTKWHAGTNTPTSRFILPLVSLWAPPRRTSHIWILYKHRLFNCGVKIEAIILANAYLPALHAPLLYTKAFTWWGGWHVPHTPFITICTLDATQPAQLILMHVWCALWGWEANACMHTGTHSGQRYAKMKEKKHSDTRLMAGLQWPNSLLKWRKTFLAETRRRSSEVHADHVTRRGG